MSTSTERAAALVIASVLLAGCTIGDAGGGAESSDAAPTTAGTSATIPSSSVPAATPPPSGAPPKPGSWQVAFVQALGRIDGDASVAVAGIGGPPVEIGGGGADAAWSTSKVPVSMAALARNPTVTENIRAAIVESDNAAAEAVWASLGTPAQAGAATGQVLRDGGDGHTVVQTKRVRPEYTAFGQTAWADGDAAAFAARVPCTQPGATVLELMRQVAGNQQWGLYGLAGAQSVGVKGGWGPGKDGAYLVRQLAVVQTQRGTTGAMLTVRPRDGSMASGQAALTRLAATFSAQLYALPAGRC